MARQHHSRKLLTLKNKEKGKKNKNSTTTTQNEQENVVSLHPSNSFKGKTSSFSLLSLVIHYGIEPHIPLLLLLRSRLTIDTNPSDEQVDAQAAAATVCRDPSCCCQILHGL